VHGGGPSCFDARRNMTSEFHARAEIKQFQERLRGDRSNLLRPLVVSWIACGACHRGRIRATRWLAMTVGNAGVPYLFFHPPRCPGAPPLERGAGPNSGPDWRESVGWKILLPLPNSGLRGLAPPGR
jgi:hypothetical protein